MKNLIILIAFTFLLGSNAFGQSGIRFSEGTWKELLAKADQENKLIFVDAYAEWCGPCKKMSKEVFTEKTVGDFYNAKFVNVKMDMEKGEGIGLASQFGIMAYPTLLFIDEKGEVVHRAVGYHTSDMFVSLGETAIDPNRNFGGIKAKYDKGDRSPGLLHDYAMAKYEAMDATYADVAEEYIKTQTDLGTEKNMEFIFRMASEPDSKMFDYFVKNRKAFEAKFGERAVAGKVEEMVQSKIYNAETESDLKEVEQFYAKVYPEKAEEMSARLRMGFFGQKEDWPNFAKAATTYYNKYPVSDWSELNEIAWVFFEMIDNKKDLKSALGWAKKSVALESNYYNNDTMASLLYKLGKKKKALKAANKAIELAKASGEDYSGTEALIEEIKKK